MESPTTSNIDSISSGSSSGDSYARQQQNVVELSLIEEDAKFAARLAQEEAMKGQLECESDAALAIYMQKQFDLEYNHGLKRQEERLNGSSKVGISLNRFKRTIDSKVANNLISDKHSSFDKIKDEDEDDYFQDDALAGKQNPDSREAWDVFEECELKRKSRMMGRSGFVLDDDGNLITKHDIPTSSRKNMCRLMELKTDIQTGDAGGIKDDFKITNYVYNKLKVHSKKSSRRASQRLFDKKEKEKENGALAEDAQTAKTDDDEILAQKLPNLSAGVDIEVGDTVDKIDELILDDSDKESSSSSDDDDDDDGTSSDDAISSCTSDDKDDSADALGETGNEEKREFRSAARDKNEDPEAKRARKKAFKEAQRIKRTTNKTPKHIKKRRERSGRSNR